MKAEVNFQTAVCRERLLADVTLEVLDARVRLDVRRQRALHGKRAETLRTLVGLLMRVHAHVTYEIGRLLELLRAVRALMPTHAVHLNHERHMCHSITADTFIQIQHAIVLTRQ